jgi:CRISPR-associated protein Cmr3
VTTTTIALFCRDPIVARDGRPFGPGQGNRMRPVSWPFPSVVAGSLRAALAKEAGKEFTDATTADLRQVTVSGVFPLGEDGQLYLPAPEDCIVVQDNRTLRVRPEEPRAGDGCDWPEDGLLPVVLPMAPEEEDFQPKDGPAWWPRDELGKWLAGGEAEVAFDRRFLQAPEVEERTHVQLNPESGAGEAGMLFTTAALNLTHLPRYGSLDSSAPWHERFAAIRLVTRAEAVGWAGATAADLNRLHPLGGERRLVGWKANPSVDWSCPGPVAEALRNAQRVRMVLATPALFAGGWKPQWLQVQLTGSPPEGGPRLKLVGFTIQRWRAVSGWSLAEPRGPKPVRRSVPAGGVYFFEVVGDPNASGLVDQWLRPVSDEAQDRRDGFGLAVWGTW